MGKSVDLNLYLLFFFFWSQTFILKTVSTDFISDTKLRSHFDVMYLESQKDKYY